LSAKCWGSHAQPGFTGNGIKDDPGSRALRRSPQPHSVPAVQDYYQRLEQRPSIARALTEEHALYAAEQARHKAA